MKVTSLQPPGLTWIEITKHRDERGLFAELFSASEFEKHGLPSRFVQTNHSHSSPGVLRGLHYQAHPPQGKLVTVLHGRIWDVTVDLRFGLPTFGHCSSVEISADHCRLLWIPAGFAHGFCVLGNESADVVYQVDAPYAAAGEGGIHWADPELAISWPLREPIVSSRDRRLGTLAEYRAHPAFLGCP